jgi:small-conductance mechanosensitive channel
MTMRRLALVLLAALAFAPAQQAPAPLPLRADQVLDHLKDSIAWYRHVNTVEQTPALASDVLLRDSTHNSALKSLQLAFEFGHAAANLLDTAAAGPPSAGTPTRNLAQAATRAAARVESLQAKIKELDTSLETARGEARETIRAQRSTVQAELTLALQVRDTVNALAAFSPGSASGLGPQIEDLEHTVPEAARDSHTGKAAPSANPPAPAAAAAATTNAAVVPFRAESTGIIGLATELFTLSHNRGQIRQMMSGTADLVKSLQAIRTPVLNEVRTVVRRSETLGTISGDESVDQLGSDQREIENLSARFKQLSAVLVPLGEQNIVLGTVESNLMEAMNEIAAQYTETGRYLALRLGILAIAIGVVFLISSLWRRVTFRYVRDPKRRTQFLTLRRVLVACAISIVVVLSFVTEFGSLATYAGLLTAGIAVALQNVILSVVAYFFLIGRYGIRSGDRVTISGVTGTVIDIGLVRIYLAELAGPAGELHPTGRVVVYSNSVLFQPAALFKQMPETDYVWHTIRLVLSPDSDLHLAETRVREAVDTVYQNYRHSIERQHANFEKAVDAQMAQPQPDARLRYTDAGLEVLVFYPAQIKDASATDSQIVKALQDAIAADPNLKLAAAGTPHIVTNAA